MVVELLYFVFHWLNAFPTKNGVLADFNKYCELNFGIYVQTHEEFAPRNNMAARTIGTITLG